MEIEVFECDHSIPTVSYGLKEIKKKLKKEYLGLEGREIAQLKKDGVEITEMVVQNKLAYVCDTSIKVFDMNPTLLDYPTIMVECTFFEEDEITNAKKTQHIHWNDLKPIVCDHPEIEFMLFHFSQRYRDSEIDEFFKREDLANLKVWTAK